jgi:2-dehydro-3-deoxyphosphogluconate aldolase / (4S)-4-hydroxy-2-oxoglutarate aldolase
VPEAVVGVGTVRRPEQLRQARAAGAAYAVSPGFRTHLLEASRDVSLAFLPGVATPSEVMQAADEGLTVVKLFPAEPLGGVAMLRALAPVFPEMRFCPTGGIHAGNLAAYLALPNVLCVGGSWVAPQDAVAAGDWGRIEALAAEAAAFRR